MRSISAEFDCIFKYDVINKKILSTSKTITDLNMWLGKEKDIIDIEVNESRNNKSESNQSDLLELNIRLSANNDDFLKLKRKMLVFLNPIGGSGKAMKIWNSVFLILRMLFCLFFLFDYNIILLKVKS